MNYIDIFKNGSRIHIKKKNRGKFTDYCGGHVTEECILRGKHSSNPTTRKRATFAANARKWKHQEGGILKYLMGGSYLTFYDSSAVGNPIEELEIYLPKVPSTLTQTTTSTTTDNNTLDRWKSARERLVSSESTQVSTTGSSTKKSGVRSVRNNNPGNIRHSSDKFLGEVASNDSAFKAFKDNAHGFRAMFKILKTYGDKHGARTAQDIINRWAPSGDNNNLINYAKKVQEISGIKPTDLIDYTNQDQMMKLANAMAIVESGGISPNAQDIADGWRLFAKS